ncbi:hypothetical protein O181_070544 [Austropuccinia psidii MF-1]|uniref:Helicase ATP-binding domain-containing protein n=1 Tax=Austropuccinia psidii MF-1 TaxID=1389203 RepID=A0A9Q3I9L2_9BASI|nr:hypothetical protein [Austropuccinia psidii MF-1]
MAQSHSIFVYLPNHQRAIGSLPGTLSKTLIPFLGATKTFMHCGPGGEWIENCQSNPTQILFVEGVFMTDANDPSSSQVPNLTLMFFTWYPNILFIMESFQTQDFKVKIPKEYDCNTHSQFQLFTPTFLTSNLTPASYPAVSSFISKQKLIQLPSESNLPRMNPPFHYSNPPPPSSENQTSFSLGSRNPQWPIIPSFESLSTNTPLGGLLADDIGLGKTIQAIASIGTSKEQLIATHCSTPTIIICPPFLITNWQSEISKHAQAGALHAKIYHGPTCHSLSKADILKYDIIITSYNTITQEFKQTNTSTSFIFNINWHCISLDEAHSPGQISCQLLVIDFTSSKRQAGEKLSSRRAHVLLLSSTKSCDIHQYWFPCAFNSDSSPPDHPATV